MSRLRGQIEAIERALEREVECAEVLQLIASARGAMNGLMAEVMEDHIRAHVLDPEHGHDSERMRGAECAASMPSETSPLEASKRTP